MTKIKNVDFKIEPDLMETYYSFSFNQSCSPGDYVELINSIISESVPEDVEKLCIFVSQTLGFELAKFDAFAEALSILKVSQEEFVLKAIDSILCEAELDLKVILTFYSQSRNHF